MALSTSELYLVLRARDEASRVIRSLSSNMNALTAAEAAAARHQMAVGQALMGVGIGITAVGVAGLTFFKNSTSAAIEYNRQVALTLTQVDQAGVKLATLSKIGIDIARAIPAPFDELQSSLYDIFSSMDVSVQGAQKLLRGFAKAAVAGQVDVQTAGRATISIMNAWQLKAGEVGHVNDVMFQIVRKGVGTYQEFASTIGLAIPAAVQSGQSIEQLGAMLAFLTRNGLHASRAATSAARALEVLTNPTVVTRLEKMGIHVKNTAGEFLPMNQIITQLGQKLQSLPGPEKIKVLNDLMKGGGNSIQARRFWDLAVQNFGQLNGLVKDMSNSSGALDAAYKTMANTPAAKIQQLKNDFDILKVEIGNALLPVVGDLVGWLRKLVDWFSNLSPHTRNMIVKIAALAAVIAVIVGPIVAVTGAIMMMQAAMALAGIEFATIATTAGIVIGAIAAIIAIVVLAIKYHQEIWSFMVAAWNAIKDTVLSAVGTIVSFFTGAWKSISDTVMSVVNAISTFLTSAWSAIAGAITTAWNAIAGFFTKVTKDIWGIVTTVFDAVKNFIVSIWQSDIAQFFRDILAIIYNIIRIALETYLLIVIKTFEGIKDAIVLVWDAIKTVTSAVWNFIKDNVLVPIWNAVKDVATTAFNAIKDVVVAVWDALKSATEAVWGFIKDNVLVPLWNAIKTDASAVFNIVKTAITTVWDAIKTVTSAVWGAITTVLKGAWDTITGAAQTGWNLVKSYILGPMDDVKNGISGMVNWVVSKLEWLVQKAEELAKKARDWLSKLNPLSHLSPSIVEQVQAGMVVLHKVTTGSLQQIANDVDPLARAVRDNINFSSSGPNASAPTTAAPVGSAASGTANGRSVQLIFHPGSIVIRGGATEDGAREFVDQVTRFLS